MNEPESSDFFLAPGYRFYGRKLSRQVIAGMVRRYGFIECGEIYSFLDKVCGIYPDRCALIWLSEKTGECLKNHDNGSEYFRELRILKNELEYAISIRSRPV